MSSDISLCDDRMENNYINIMSMIQNKRKIMILFLKIDDKLKLEFEFSLIAIDRPTTSR